MSLISEGERERLENLSYEELRKSGFKGVNSLKPALKKEIFYILAENPPKEAMEKLREKGIDLSFSTVCTYRSTLTSNNLVKKFRKKIEEKDKEELLQFLRENPLASIKEVKEAGYLSVLYFYYKGAINLAKQEAGIPTEYYHPYPIRQRYYFLKNIIYGLILSSIKPLYINELVEIVKCSDNSARKILSELKREGKIEYSKILGSFGRGSKKFKPCKLFNGNWRKFVAKKMAYNPNDINHLEFIAKEISSNIKRSLRGNLSLDARKALSRKLKSLPENLRILIKEHLYSV